MSEPIVIKCRRVRPEQDADIPLPRYMTPHSSGMDICAAVEQKTVMQPGEIILVPSGFSIALPVGYEAQIRPPERTGGQARNRHPQLSGHY